MNGRVFIIGLGLIGGSIALCIKKEHPHSTIIGFDIHEKEMQLAKALTVIDEYAMSIEDEASKADLIILAAPVLECEKLLTRLSTLPLKKDVIITDVGSTKAKLVNKAEELLNLGVTFIGGHPMAGSHKSGVSAAKELLFENAFYLLTPTSRISDEKVNILKNWLKGTKANFFILPPDEHDSLTGVISHFPHVIAASLVHQAEKSSNKLDLVSRFAAGGFRDITRIASSSPDMWRDILLHNKAVMLNLLNQWDSEMMLVKGLIEEEDADGIKNYFMKAKDFRDGLPVKTKGAIPSFYDLFIDVPDYPGIISEITGYLAQEEISITNIRIIETREEIYGVLVISFQTEQDRQKAEQCILNRTTYDTYLG